jgi:hypothetical protein
VVRFLHDGAIDRIRRRLYSPSQIENVSASNTMGQRTTATPSIHLYLCAAGLTAVTAVVLAGPTVHAAPDPAVLFLKKCSSSHTSGNGDRVGPDLRGVTDRRSRACVVVDSIAAADAGRRRFTAKKLFEKFKGGAVVSRSSSNTSVATVPGSVTIAAGATSQTVTVGLVGRVFERRQRNEDMYVHADWRGVSHCGRAVKSACGRTASTAQGRPERAKGQPRT